MGVARLAALGIGLLACSPAQDESPAAAVAERADGQLSVYTVNYPLQYFAERVGGDDVAVRFPAPPGIDPAYWSPEPEEATAYQAADLVFRNGAGYAAWVDRTSLLRRRLIDTSAGFRDRLLTQDEEVIHTHGPDGGHSPSAVAFTTWLDPTLAIEHARAIAGALSRSRPDRADEFRRNFAVLANDLGALDRRLEKIAEGLGGGPLVFSHPVYQYLERRYALNGRSLHWEPDRLPDPEAWRELEALLATHPARLMIWEAPPAAETRRRLAALGLAVAVYAPGAQPPESGDWLEVMQANAAGLELALAALDASARPLLSGGPRRGP